MVQHRRLLIEWVLILCLATAMVAGLAVSGATQRIDNLLYDRLIGWRAPPADDRILIVAIDDDSLRRLGRWPWRRDLHAGLIDRLRADGARAVAYDILFVEPGTGDPALAQAMRSGPPTQVPMLFEAPGLNGAPVDAVLPVEPIRTAAAGIGHVNVEADGDGLARRVALAEADGVRRPVPHLMELAYRATTGHASPAFTRSAGGRVLIPYAGRVGNFRSVSFAAVLAGEVPPAFLRGRTILVGATAEGMGDRYPAPMTGAAALPGIEIQASLLNGLLADDLVTVVRGWPLAVISLLPAWLLLAGFWRWTPARALRWSLVTIAAVLALSITVLILGGWWLAPGSALCGLLLVYPLWGWRRLQAMSAYVDQELARFAAEPDLAIPERPRRLPGDVVAAQTVRLAGAIDRIRDIRRFASDTIQRLPDPLFVADHEGRISLANAAAIDAIGVDLTGHSLDTMLAGLGANDRGADLVLADGRRFLVARAPLNDADGVQRGWIVRLADISAIRDAEEAREEVLQLLSHDMRSPQASILTLLDGDGREGLTPDLATRIGDHARRTLTLADNFVQLARITGTPFVPGDVPLYDVLAEAADALWAQARRRDVRIDIGTDAGLYMRGERASLARALINLLDNAVRFSPDGGVVRCAVVAADGLLLCTIADEGPGIAAEDLPHLFDRFSPGAGTERHSVGLGLALVKAVAERHGGHVTCQSMPGQGTIFRLTFAAID